MIGRKTIFVVAAIVLAAGLPGRGNALPFAPMNSAHTEQLDNVITVRAGGERDRGTVKRNVYVNRNVHRTVVVKRPYRAWGWRPYYGSVIGGVALGTVIGVGAAYAVPVAPAPNLCWYWADQAGWRGYWDYCVAP